MSPLSLITQPTTRAFLQEVAEERYGDMVKVVVDCKRGIMAIGGQMHADEEQELLADGSAQEDLWGINIYPERFGDDWIEFDSMINLRPRQNNRTRSVDDPAQQEKIRSIISHLVPS
jgi:hypothetical protein